MQFEVEWVFTIMWNICHSTFWFI